MKNRFLFIFLACFSAGASGYSQRTHEAISAVAFRASILGLLSQNNQLSDIGLMEQQLSGYTANGQNPNWDIQKWITQGAYDEDLNLRPLHHFFNPINQRGLLGHESALEWGLELNADIPDQDYSYKDARQYYLGGLTLSNPTTRDHFLAKTFYALGHVIHLLQDMAQPQHTRAEAHNDYINGTQSALYEKWTEDVLNAPNGLDLLFLNTNFPDIYPGARQLFDKPEKFWQTGHYLPTSILGYGDGVAEFSNFNFLTQYYNCNNSRFPNPVCSVNQQVTVSDIQALCTGPSQDAIACSIPPQLSANLTGQIVFQETDISGPLLPSHQGVNDRASTFSLFEPLLITQPDPLGTEGWTQNRFNFRRAQEFLIPQAVGYSVGMLNYFFHGSMDASMSANGNVIIENTSSEVMDGTFTLYYDDAADVRNPVSISGAANCTNPPNPPGFGVCLKISPGVTGSLGLLTPPTSPLPKKPGKYILVFIGKMGQESDAVVGRVFHLRVVAPPPDIPEPGSGVLIIAGLCVWSLVRASRTTVKPPSNLSRISALD